MAANKDSWKDVAKSFLAPQKATHVVGTRETNFYPISVKALLSSREVLKPLARALRVLFAQNTSDQGTTRRTVGDAGEILISPIAPELAKLRHEQVDKALAELIDALTDDKNATVIGQLLVDALRDDFERDSMDPASCLAFVRGMDATTLSDMIVGFAKGNKKVLGPFGEILGETLGQFSAQVTSVVERLKAQPTTTNS